MDTVKKNQYALMIHAGAGIVHQKKDEYQPILKKVLTHGQQQLAQGASALDVVSICTMMMEDEPLFNAGRGSVLNKNGDVEMDAAIMDGRDCQAGSIAAVPFVRNPIQLARIVMEQSPHVMLIGHGALEFAKQQGVPMEPLEYFITPQRLQQWEEAKQKDAVQLDHFDHKEKPQKKTGTVGAVAYDQQANLAAATSTGGMTYKQFGRVGDSSIIGAGVFADNESAAVSTTGIGEHFLRLVIARVAAEYCAQGMTAECASEAIIAYYRRKIQGSFGGLIMIDRNGRCGSARSTPDMMYGQATPDGVVVLG